MKKVDETILINAKNLRSNMTDFEQMLWYFFRAKRFLGLKFKRQVPIGNYIVDFLCIDKKVIVELDGSQHLKQVEYDKQRDKFLNDKGYKVIRITNNEISNIDGVLHYIKDIIENC